MAGLVPGMHAKRLGKVGADWNRDTGCDVVRLE
jgi:hypothetical protein